jgi:hypothetical protein
MTKKRVDLRGQQRDLNEPGIVAALCAVGCYVQRMDKSAGFDLLVGYANRYFFGWRWYVIEVKNTGGKFVTRAELEKMLTKNERETMQLMQATGGEYHIVTDAAAALAAVGIDTAPKTR